MPKETCCSRGDDLIVSQAGPGCFHHTLITWNHFVLYFLLFYMFYIYFESQTRLTDWTSPAVWLVHYGFLETWTGSPPDWPGSERYRKQTRTWCVSFVSPVNENNTEQIKYRTDSRKESVTAPPGGSDSSCQAGQIEHVQAGNKKIMPPQQKRLVRKQCTNIFPNKIYLIFLFYKYDVP